MKKILFVFGLSAAMIACQGEKSEQTNDPESHTHEAGEEHGHEHATPEEGGTLTKDARVMPTEGASVFFVNLEDGATVSSPIHVEMGVDGMMVEAAGEAVVGAGHHHILINDEDGMIPQGEVVPMNATNLHYGKGQVETDLELEPGEYTLSLQFANGYHESYGEQMSKTIKVIVE